MENNGLNNVNSVASELEDSIEGKSSKEEYTDVVSEETAEKDEKAQNETVITPENIAEKVGEQKYKVARYSLLIVTVLSIVNLFSLIFNGTYFLFSSYITLMIGATGGFIYAEADGDIAILIATVIIGVISVVPYILCWIFSKKKVGWLICAMVLFAFDTLLLLVDTITALDATYVIDLALHGYFVYEMVVAIKYGLKKKKEANANI